MLVFSHDPYFLRLVWKDYSEKSSIKTLYIKRQGDSSVISEWDIEKETQSDYFRNYFALSEYLEKGPSGNLQDIARCIRSLLEENLRMRFPGHFLQKEWLGDFIGKIRNSQKGNVLYDAKHLLLELEEINNYSKDFHHDTNSFADSQIPNDIELKGYVKRTLKLISGILAIDN